LIELIRMKKYRYRVLVALLALTGYFLSSTHISAQTIPTEITLQEKVVLVAKDGNNAELPNVTVPGTASSGANSAAASNSTAPSAIKNSSSVILQTTIFMPPGSGPFPVLVLNHGKSPGDPHLQERARFLSISKEFVKRGYAVVIPMRTGFGKSTGVYVEEECNMTSNGLIQAQDIENILKYTLRQKWADKNHILVAGQSYGGLAAMAFGTRHFPGVQGLINFAGGLRTTGSDCDWQASLVDAFSTYGSKTAIPSVWFYGANDSYFKPALASRLHDAYVHAGGNAHLIAYGDFKKDAHAMSGSRDGVAIWWPEVEKFLREIDMPTGELYSFASDMRPVKTGFAGIGDIDAIPYLQMKGREGYRSFLGKSLPRAFALSASGAWSWAEDGDNPSQTALAQCNRISHQPCKLYAVDNEVVWNGMSGI
jgi:dienelactone hydrolase